MQGEYIHRFFSSKENLLPTLSPHWPAFTSGAGAGQGTLLAAVIDLLIIAVSLLVATTVAHYATTDMLPAPADVLFALNERFAAHEVAIASAALLSAYFILFKLLTGFTLGEAILGSKRR